MPFRKKRRFFFLNKKGRLKLAEGQKQNFGAYKKKSERKTQKTIKKQIFFDKTRP